MIRRTVERFGEIIGFAIYLLPILIQLRTGDDIDDVIFDKVISIVNISLTLREMNILLFWGMWVLNFGLVLLVFNPSRLRIQETYQNWIQISARILTGWILGNVIIYWQINAVFYRNAVVTFPFLLGSAILGLSLISIRFDGLMGENIFRWRKEMNEGNQQPFNVAMYSIRPLRYLGLIILAVILILPNQAPITGFYPEPPGLPEKYGGEPGDFPVKQYRLEHNVPSNVSSYLLPDNANSSWYIFMYVPQIQTSQELPVVLYAHGYTGTNPRDYENTLYQVASRGSIAIFVQYATDVELFGELEEIEETNFTASNAMYIRYLMVWNGIIQAIEYLEDQGRSSTLLGSSKVNTDYVQIIGHSVGGGMVPYLATETIRQGWGNQQLILDLETPWFSSENPLVDYDLDILPDHTIVNVVGTHDDHLASPCQGMQHFERFFATLPTDNTAYLVIPSDYYGFPRLVATHYVVTSALDDTLTKYGYLKRVDAMAAYLVALANGEDGTEIRNYFVGGQEEMISQGKWSDGTPVKPLQYSIDPYGLRGGENLAAAYIDAHEMGPDICLR